MRQKSKTVEESINHYISKITKYDNIFNEKKDIEKTAIYHAIKYSLSSNWFEEIGYYSKIDICKQAEIFLEWLTIHKVNSKNYFNIVNTYTEYRVNICKTKPQSSGCKVIIRAFKHGINLIPKKYTPIIRHLIWSTKVIHKIKPIQSTLTNYFTQVHWLKNYINPKKYILLESPKQLISSFTTLAASLLIEIVNARKKVINFIEQSEDIKQFRSLSSGKFEIKYGAYLTHKLITFDSNHNLKDTFSEILISDLVSKKYEDIFFETWPFKKPGSSLIDGIHQKKRFCPFNKSKIFQIDSFSFPSRTEETLMRWLCAAQSIQASDINHLKNNNFIVEHNSKKEPILLQCKYFKGRSQNIYETPLLEAKTIQAKAMIAYLSYFPETSTKLFKYPNLKTLSVRQHNLDLSYNLLKLLRRKNIHLNNVFIKNHKANKSTDIFLTSLLALINNTDINYSEWERKKIALNEPSSTTDYNQEIDKPIPVNLFTPSAIKNTAVHARTDKYRNDDLVNYNSHSSQTEKLDYLSDENKEWVNQHGRITRLVMNDLSNYIFKPSLNSAIKKARNSTLITKVIAVTGDVSARILMLPYSAEPLYEYENNEIIILDTEDTVVNMLHYTEQAKKKYSLLIKSSLEYFERTVLPTVEWMHYVLEQKLSPLVVKNGIKKYKKIKEYLPEMFLPESLSI